MDEWEDFGPAELIDADTDTEPLDRIPPAVQQQGRAQRHRTTRVRRFVYPDGTPTEDFEPDEVIFPNGAPSGWFDD